MLTGSSDESRPLDRERFHVAFRLSRANIGYLSRANIGYIVNEGAGRSFPGMLGGKFKTGLGRNFQRRQAGRAQIVVQRADRRGADDVTGTGYGKGCDRQAACQRLQQNQAKGIGLARKYEDVGSRIDVSQGFALKRAEKHGLRIGPHQRIARRSIADNDLAAGEIESKKRFQIFFHRDPADAQKHRARQAEVGVARLREVKAAGIEKRPAEKPR